jgi:hypothetical protein
MIVKSTIMSGKKASGEANGMKSPRHRQEFEFLPVKKPPWEPGHSRFSSVQFRKIRMMSSTIGPLMASDYL